MSDHHIFFCIFFFFFNDTATTEIYTLSLHDALPIYDAAARARHHHPALRDHAPAELTRGDRRGLIGRRPRGAEDGDLAHAAVRREDLVRVAQLLERGVGDLEVARERPVFVELEHRGEELLVVEPAVRRHARHIEELENQAVGGVPLELVTVRFGHVFEYTVTAPRCRMPGGRRRGSARPPRG